MSELNEPAEIVTIDEALTEAEATERKALEAKAIESLRQVGQGLADFAQAVTQIRERRLYRPLTWEKYCKDTFGRCGETLNRIIRHGQNLKSLEDYREMGLCALMPEVESQTRALDGLPPAQKAAAWELASGHGSKQPTQAEVRQAAEIVKLQPGDGVMLWEPPDHIKPEEVWSCLEIEEVNGIPTTATISMGGAPIRVPFSNIRGLIPALSLAAVQAPSESSAPKLLGSADEVDDPQGQKQFTEISPEVLFRKRLIKLYAGTYALLLEDLRAMKSLDNDSLALLIDNATYASDQIHQRLQELQRDEDARNTSKES